MNADQVTEAGLAEDQAGVLRACAIAALKVGDVFEDDGAVSDTIYLAAAQTKGDEANTVLVSKRLAKALSAYTATYPHHCSNLNRRNGGRGPRLLQ